MNTKKSLLIFGIVVGVLLLVFFAFWIFTKETSKQPGLSPNKVATLPAETKSTQPQFVVQVPKNAILTTPVIEVPASQNTNSKIRVFNLSASQSGFSPNVLTVKIGTTVNINFSGSDGDYDVAIPYLGMHQFAKQGEQKTLIFVAGTQGTFLFECRDFCPLGKKIEGKLIVTP